MDTQQRKKFKILLLGDSCKDIYHYGVCDNISPEAPVPILRQTRTVTKPGMSANVFGNLLAFGIEVDHLTNDDKIEKHRFIDERYNQHLLRHDIGEEKKLAPLNLELIDESRIYDAIVISDYNKGFLREVQCSYICQLYDKIPIFVDTKKNNLTCFYKCVIKINEKEHKEIQEFPINSEFIVTLGAKGALYNHKHFFHTRPIEVFDVCGAGDVFLAALVYGFLSTKSMHQAIELANECARISVSKMGTYTLSQKDIHDICI